MSKTTIESAYVLLNESVLRFGDRAVGTVASLDAHAISENYQECFVRDFVPAALVFLADGNIQIVRNFLRHVLQASDQQTVMEGHQRASGLMPASFRVGRDADGHEAIIADFGDRAIGRVAPVDSALWWLILLRTYVVASGDKALAFSPGFQQGIRSILRLYLTESFETSPALLVPDGSFMIDRRMGVGGHPLEIQSLFFGALRAVQELLLPNSENLMLLSLAKKRMQTLRSYVRLYYWLDIERLNQIHRFHSEEFGTDAENILNIYPECIPDWIDGWMTQDMGYLVGNLGPGKIDFRFFALGNLLAILFGLATEQQGEQIMKLYECHWMQLVGHVPLKIAYPAIAAEEWSLMTGSDPKNVPWSYHNGGNWPCLLWVFTAAALRTGRLDLAERALEAAMHRLPRDQWPEYYDGRHGSLIGRRASLRQVWSATGLILSHHCLENPDSLRVIESFVY
jgi:hypothetical protein